MYLTHAPNGGFGVYVSHSETTTPSPVSARRCELG